MWLMLLCSAVMGIGTSVGGEKIIKAVGMDMVKLEKYQGFSADLSAALCLLLSSVFGIPVSTTHTKTSAIMGVGAVKRLSAINFGVVKDMVLTWVFTFPRLWAHQLCNGKIVYGAVLSGIPSAQPATAKGAELWRKKQDSFYYENFSQCVACACQAAPLSGGCPEKFPAGTPARHAGRTASGGARCRREKARAF